MTRLIIIRHGYSKANKEKCFSGQMDVPLDDIGVAQAALTAKYVLANYKVDRIYVSDLIRAIDTVQPIANALQMPIIKDRQLREVDVGVWQGMPVAEVQEKYPEQYAFHKAHIGLTHFEGGEKYADFVVRAKTAIEKIAAQNEGKTVVIGTHGGLVRALRSVWDSVPLENIKSIPPLPNASVTVVEYENKNVHQVLVGYTGHLEGHSTEPVIK